MAKDYAKSFYKSKAWQECRKGYIYSVHGLCEKCQRPGDIVHHKEYITPGNIDNPDITLNWNNLEYLCQTCHNREHHGSGEPMRDDVMFDDEGNLIAR